MQVYFTISPSCSPTDVFYWRGNNISASNDRLEICLNNLLLQLDFSSRYLLVFCFLLVFCQRDIAHCLSQHISFSPVLLLVSPLNNLINVHTVPNAPDIWVILIQILQLFCVYPLAYLLVHWALHKPWASTWWIFTQRQSLHNLVLPLLWVNSLCWGWLTMSLSKPRKSFSFLCHNCNHLMLLLLMCGFCSLGGGKGWPPPRP